MPSNFDPSDFEDHEFKAAREAQLGGVAGQAPVQQAVVRPPSRDDVEKQVSAMHQQLADLKRAQENLERERAHLEETRRRQAEFESGRSEMLDQLNHSVGLLEEAELDRRREVDQMASTLADLRDSLNKVRSLRDDQWAAENYHEELSRSIAMLDNARMELNSARLRFPFLTQTGQDQEEKEVAKPGSVPLGQMDWPSLCRLGLAMTWPLVLTGIGIIVLLFIMLRQST